MSWPLCLEPGATTIMAVHLLNPECHPMASRLSWLVPLLATQPCSHLHVCLLGCHFTLGGFWPLPDVPFPLREASLSNFWGGTEGTMNACDPEGLSTWKRSTDNLGKPLTQCVCRGGVESMKCFTGWQEETGKGQGRPTLKG